MKQGMNFEKMTVHELIADDDFICWVKHPNESRNQYWNKVIDDFPKVERVILEAKQLVLSVRIKETLPPVGAKERILANIRSQTKKEEKEVRMIRIPYLFRIAAGIVGFAVAGLWVYLKYADKSAGGLDGSQQVVYSDTKAGMIYLNDGRSIALEDLQNGIIVEDGTTHIAKEGNNRLVYQKGSLLDKVGIDSITTAIGKQWQIELPDQSIVWLNSGSVIRFPKLENGTSRTASVSGEAYFEVAHDAKAPFLIEVNQVNVKVLGTHFNISSYYGDVLDITLLEGIVQVERGDHVNLIKPGQRARYRGEALEPEISHVNVNQVVAWKEGLFSFDGDSIDEVMSQIQRWYGVNIEYVGTKPHDLITGTIPRESTLKDVLAILQDTGSDAQFTLSNRKLIVKRKE